jgi:hypothetical protein
LLKGGLSSGYRTLRYKMYNGKKTVDKSLFLYKIVAGLFVPKGNEEQQYVIHLDHSRDNDDAANLRWYSKEEALAHRRKSPNVIASIGKLKAYKAKADGAKLTTTKVMHLKKIWELF